MGAPDEAIELHMPALTLGMTSATSQLWLLWLLGSVSECKRRYPYSARTSSDASSY